MSLVIVKVLDKQIRAKTRAEEGTKLIFWEISERLTEKNLNLTILHFY